MRRRAIILAVSVLGVFLLAFSAVSMVFSEYSNDDGVIRGAYNPNTGSLRIVTDGNYRGNEVPLEWNKEGPQGQEGPQGEAGPQGPQGELGPPGISGVDEEQLQSLLTTIATMQAQITTMQAQIDVLLDYHRFISQQVSFPSIDFYDVQADGMHEGAVIVDDFAGSMVAPSNYLEAGFVTISCDSGSTVITSHAPGTETFIIQNYAHMYLDEHFMIALLTVTVTDSGEILYTILPWVEGSHMFVERDPALGYITHVTVADQGIVEIVPVFGGVNTAFIVFSSGAGETTIVVTYDGGATDVITVEVDASREIIVFGP